MDGRGGAVLILLMVGNGEQVAVKEEQRGEGIHEVENRIC